MKTSKIYFALISVNTAKIKTVNNSTVLLSDITTNDIMLFDTKTKANEFIDCHLCFGLMPIKVILNCFDGKIKLYS